MVRVSTISDNSGGSLSVTVTVNEHFWPVEDCTMILTWKGEELTIPVESEEILHHRVTIEKHIETDDEPEPDEEEEESESEEEYEDEEVKENYFYFNNS